MRDLILSYFVYNLVVGLFLVIYYFFTSNNELKPKEIIWLLVFPAAGLGKWRFVQETQKRQHTEFPERWFVWKYMIRVNWGFIGLLGFLPVGLLLAALIGISVGGITDFNGYTDIESMVGAGIFLMTFALLTVMVLVLIIPFLILVYFPMYQKKKIEQAIFYQVLNDRLVNKNETVVDVPTSAVAASIPLLPELELYVRARVHEFSLIPKDRRKELEDLSRIVKAKLTENKLVNIAFICTHNARRSQFGQVWAAVAAGYFGIRNIQTYSGGTEATAFNKRAVAAIQRAGLSVTGTVGTNPRYSVRFSDQMGALDCYSKTFDDPANPQQKFMAIMTCSDADQDCPFVAGAEHRTKLFYDDPKVADGTTSESRLYDERCAEIATEMLFLFSKV
jgi:arsenate reductase